MADFCDALRAKFGPLRPTPAAPEPLRPTPQPALGKRRKRMTLRLSTETAANLRILRIALGHEMNGLCEEVLSKAVAERLAELEANANPGEWDVIVRCATGPGAAARNGRGVAGNADVEDPAAVGTGREAMASSKPAARGGSMVRTGGKAEGSGTSHLA